MEIDITLNEGQLNEYVIILILLQSIEIITNELILYNK